MANVFAPNGSLLKWKKLLDEATTQQGLRQVFFITFWLVSTFFVDDLVMVLSELVLPLE